MPRKLSLGCVRVLKLKVHFQTSRLVSLILCLIASSPTLEILEVRVHIKDLVSNGIDYNGQLFSKNGGTRKLLKCAQGEQYRGSFTDSDLFSRKNTKMKACKCTFKIMVKLIGNAWIILTKPRISSMHNHPLTVYPEGYHQMRGLSVAAKLIVRDMSAAQAKSRAILATLQETIPSDNPTRRHVYNYRDNLRKSSFEDRDVVGQCYHLAQTHNYLHWTLAEESTGVTNKYHMPFFEIIEITPSNKNFYVSYAIMKYETDGSYSWILERLRFLIGDHVQPTAILADRELGLLRPVKEIFSHTSHLLCTWHISKDVEDIVSRLCGKDRGLTETFMNTWKKIIKAQTDKQYEASLTTMRDRVRAFPAVILYIERIWLMHKEKFVSCWTNKVLHFGHTTTSRVESAHAQLK
ncbi:uncharacterized protein LOC126656781 [Mercurialis annua]|uniref:uncharacterized protein LOC126656781 n=1 Tax=Mercurialis annua TaxID=3986 RepID=UPI00215EFC3C|nr:uncharacterized protein LOC126656781 [Mercurialis annua]